MKLSTAIREGAKKRPQCHGVLYLHSSDQTNTSGVVESCAIGAGLEGAGVINPESLNYPCRPKYRLYEHFEGEFIEALVSCPHSPGCPIRGQIRSMMEHLNDNHLWTREDIADWLESIGY